MTAPELVARQKNDFSISPPVDRLSAGGRHVVERRTPDGEMSEGELVDAFRHVSDAF